MCYTKIQEINTAVNQFVDLFYLSKNKNKSNTFTSNLIYYYFIIHKRKHVIIYGFIYIYNKTCMYILIKTYTNY